MKPLILAALLALSACSSTPQVQTLRMRPGVGTTVVTEQRETAICQFLLDATHHGYTPHTAVRWLIAHKQAATDPNRVAQIRDAMSAGCPVFLPALRPWLS